MNSRILSPENPNFPPAANTLYVQPCELGPPPSFYYELRKITPAQTQDDPPLDRTTIDMLANGNVSMTPEQWSDWTDQDDEPYILACVAKNLGLVLA